MLRSTEQLQDCRLLGLEGRASCVGGYGGCAWEVREHRESATAGRIRTPRPRLSLSPFCHITRLPCSGVSSVTEHL